MLLDEISKIIKVGDRVHLRIDAKHLSGNNSGVSHINVYGVCVIVYRSGSYSRVVYYLDTVVGGNPMGSWSAFEMSDPIVSLNCSYLNLDIFSKKCWTHNDYSTELLQIIGNTPSDSPPTMPEPIVYKPKYTTECPCGIHPNSCVWHKGM